MSEIVMFVAAIAGAVWLALGVLAMGFLVFDRQPQKKAGVKDAARPEVRRAA